MTENEHLLLCLAEECDKVSQRVMKALRFGLNEIQDGQPLTNSHRIVEELHDLFAVAEILCTRGVINNPYPLIDQVQAKREKIFRFMEIGRAQGVLPSNPTWEA